MALRVFTPLDSLMHPPALLRVGLCILAPFSLWIAWHLETPLAIAITLSILLCSWLIADHLLRPRLAGPSFPPSIATVLDALPRPCLVTDEGGRVLYRNAAAIARFGQDEGEAMLAPLRSGFADPAAALHRLHALARRKGRAFREVQLPDMRLQIEALRLSETLLLWHLTELPATPLSASNRLDAQMLGIVAKADGQILEISPALRQHLGYSPRHLRELLGRTEFASGETATLLSKEGPQQVAFLEPDPAQEPRRIYLAPLRIADRSRVLFELEDLPVALLHLNPSGAILAANAEARQMLSLREDAWEGQRQLYFFDYVEGLGRPLKDWIADIAVGRIPPRAEILSLSQGERERFTQVMLRPLSGTLGEGLLAVLTDATDVKQLETQFLQSQKMQAIGQLAGGVAHDFNNLLTAMMGHCDLLLMRHQPLDGDYNDLMQIQQNAHRAAALVQQLLAFSRKQTLRADYLRVNDVLDDVKILLTKLVGEKYRLSFRRFEGSGAIRVDRRQLEQVLMNLVVNARDAMADGGQIALEARAEHLREDLRRDRATVPAGSYVVLRVIDHGPGIPPALRERVFEEFFSTKRPGEGTGLGLSMTYGIVKQSGGFIFIDEAEGGGAVFSVYLQLHPEELVPPDRSAPVAPSAALLRATILLVEDEPSVRAFTARALKLRGHRVLEASGGEEALRHLQDPDLPVDITVSDVIMPDMDGPSWVRRAREARPDLKVIFVSGYARENFAGQQDLVEGSVFLPKPYSLEDLTNLVQGCLAGDNRLDQPFEIEA